MKKKILFKNDAWFLNSGYSNYGRELMTNLAATGKYELAELSCYASENDPRLLKAKWKCYGNAPTKQDDQTFHSNPLNAYGLWRWEETCLDFKPDVVLCINDIWGDIFTLESPYRRFYNLGWMSTVDAKPQQEEWIAAFSQLDGFLTYTDWGTNIVKQQAGDKIKYYGAAGGGPSLDIFKPVLNKNEFKKQATGHDVLLVGTVMRNQKRKLYPDLIKGFELFLQKCRDNNNDALAEKTYLYIHSSYPDVGWDFPRLIKESKIGHKIFFSYFCRNCKITFPSLWNDARVVCPQCRHFSGTLPNTQDGTDLQTLSNIYNLFDVYVQYATLEGLGIPMLEAGACGVPIMAINYSAMEDVLGKLKGVRLDPLAYYRETETHRYFSVPNNQLFADELYKFLNLPESIRRKKGFDARKGVEKHYDWNDITEKWMSFIDSQPNKKSWDSPAQIHNPDTNINPNQSNESFMSEAIMKITGDDTLLSTYKTQIMIRDLNYGARSHNFNQIMLGDMSMLGKRPGHTDYNRNHVVQDLLSYVNNVNYWEKRRIGAIKEPKPTFVQIADKWVLQ